MATKPDKKEYQLKDIESRLLLVAQQQYQALLSNLLSFIALERLAVKVDEHTAFELKSDLTGFTMWQNDPESETTDTAKATKGSK